MGQLLKFWLGEIWYGVLHLCSLGRQLSRVIEFTFFLIPAVLNLFFVQVFLCTTVFCRHSTKYKRCSGIIKTWILVLYEKKRLRHYFTENFNSKIQLVKITRHGFISSRSSRILLITMWYFYAIPSRYGRNSTICVFSYHDTTKLYASKKNLKRYENMVFFTVTRSFYY